MNSNNRILESLNDISFATEEARSNVLESYISLDKKYTMMEKNGVTVGSVDPIIESFIENRSTLVPQYIEETAKGKNKLIISLMSGCIVGGTVGAVLIHNVVLGALVFSGVGTAIIIDFAASYLAAIVGGKIGIKIADAMRRKGIRGEILKDIKDMTTAILLVKPSEGGSFILDKNAKKAISNLAESINTFKRVAVKAEPPATRDEIDAYSDVHTAIFALNSNPTGKNADNLLSAMNRAAEICMKQSGIDVSDIKTETKDAIKKATAEEKSAAKNNDKKDGE